MPRYNVVFGSKESILGVVPRVNDWVTYSWLLKIVDGGKLPVSLEMTFIPPHPYSVDMPLVYSIKADSSFSLLAGFRPFRF
jgi:hypothetical protein